MCKFINYTQANEIANTFLEVLDMTICTKTNIGNEGRTELHDKLALTGAEISITFICIQVKENSLDGFTAGDAVVY